MRYQKNLCQNIVETECVISEHTHNSKAQIELAFCCVEHIWYYSLEKIRRAIEKSFFDLKKYFITSKNEREDWKSITLMSL